MSAPKVKSGRLAHAATILMIALGVFSLLVNVSVAVILIVLGVAMFLFERRLVRGVRRSREDSG